MSPNKTLKSQSSMKTSPGKIQFDDDLKYVRQGTNTSNFSFKGT
jgi:hypothetical protein